MKSQKMRSSLRMSRSTSLSSAPPLFDEVVDRVKQPGHCNLGFLNWWFSPIADGLFHGKSCKKMDDLKADPY
jgi:hypothetical protein